MMLFRRGDTPASLNGSSARHLHARRAQRSPQRQTERSTARAFPQPRNVPGDGPDVRFWGCQPGGANFQFFLI
jgi:hypothetical protein